MKVEEIKEFFLEHKKKIIVLAGFLVVLSVGILSFYLINSKFNNETVKTEDSSLIAKTEEVNETKETPEMIKVDVKGMVINPGVYEIPLGSRVMDAIDYAGGLTEDAYTRYINLSQILKDESVIIINSKSEIDLIKAEENTDSICENRNQVCVSKDNTVTNDINNNLVKTETKIDKETPLNISVNINKASLSELLTLSGIGESKAKNIIEYRNSNGEFKTIEDIKNVKGIGESIYAKIKENITV